MDIAPSTAGPDPRPDQDRPGAAVPARIAEILPLVRTLTTYGRHLSGLITRPATWFGFVIIARFFGTVAVPDMAARIQRGLMRLAALEAMLLRRARRGTDLVVLARPRSGPRKPRRTAPPSEQEPRSPTLDSVPTQQDVEAWVRRRPIGRTIAAICLDLGIAPAICQPALWNRIAETTKHYRGSLATVMKEVRRRVDQFESQDWTNTPVPWPDLPPAPAMHPFGAFTGQQVASTGPP